MSLTSFSAACISASSYISIADCGFVIRGAGGRIEEVLLFCVEDDAGVEGVNVAVVDVGVSEVKVCGVSGWGVAKGVDVAEEAGVSDVSGCWDKGVDAWGVDCREEISGVREDLLDVGVEDGIGVDRAEDWVGVEDGVTAFAWTLAIALDLGGKGGVLVVEAVRKTEACGLVALVGVVRGCVTAYGGVTYEGLGLVASLRLTWGGVLSGNKHKKFAQ